MVPWSLCEWYSSVYANGIVQEGTEKGAVNVRYRRRAVDNELDELMPGVAAIAIEGARAVGKTATASARATTVFKLDTPAVYDVLRADPERIATSPRPVLIDEWQRMKETWDVVRRAVDAEPSGGQFLLTGSASPKNPPTHTGAARIVSLRMRPMTLSERGGSQTPVHGFPAEASVQMLIRENNDPNSPPEVSVLAVRRFRALS